MKPIPDDILIKALEMQDQGKTPEQICASFPKAAEELQQYFHLMAGLRAAALSIIPSRELLQAALRRASAEQAQVPVAQLASVRFFGRVPRMMRLFAPALAVVVLLVLADRLSVVAPSSPVPEIVTPPGTQIISESQALPQAGQTTARTFAVPVPKAAPAPQSPGAAADQVTEAFLSSAHAEQNNLSDTSAAQQAAQANDSQSAQDVASPTTQI